jgi:Janus/Ocnus family (Ocnus)
MELETIRITPDIKQKYVLVRVIYDGEKRLILWGNPNIQWHKDILEDITKSGYEISEVLGGGWLLPHRESGSVYVWGKSDRLGVAPINLVKEVLKGEVIEQEPK